MQTADKGDGSLKCAVMSGLEMPLAAHLNPTMLARVRGSHPARASSARWVPFINQAVMLPSSAGENPKKLGTVTFVRSSAANLLPLNTRQSETFENAPKPSGLYPLQML